IVNLFKTSPYTKILSTRNYTEIDDTVCRYLNEDWTLKPQLRYACARILAGSIWINTQTGSAIIANTVEIYGRTKNFDAHREPFTQKKEQPVPTSIPPPLGCRYKDVWPTTLHSPEGDRLVLGTHTCNILVTSSLRVDDKNHQPSLGGTTVNFKLESALASSSTEIFLDKDSFEEAVQIINSKEATSVSPTNLLFQLRQLKTKFHDSSTFLRCRASGPLTKSHVCQPYTIFTLSSFDGSNRGNGRAASALFKGISDQFLRSETDPRLLLSAVQKLNEDSTGNTHMKDIARKILDLYQGEDAIAITNNYALNVQLEALAKHMSSYITTANAT
ncbi:hypothetical protein EDD11_009938, partial [Mortierella claussenii]